MNNMLASSPLIAFVPTLDPERARVFYRDTVGLRLVSDEIPLALVFDANGTMLRVTVVQQLTPAQYTILGWHVTDIRAAAADLQKAGVLLTRYEGFVQQDELGIWRSPSGAQIAWFKDPDGNTLSLTQF